MDPTRAITVIRPGRDAGLQQPLASRPDLIYLHNKGIGQPAGKGCAMLRFDEIGPRWTLGLLLLAAGAGVPQPAHGLAVSDRVPAVAEPFDLADVRLLEGPFRAAQETDRAWLLRVDDDRMLHNFRVTAGLPSTARPYGGWEDPKCELRGHSLGHYLNLKRILPLFLQPRQ